VGERVNKIRFVGSINKEVRFRKSVRVSDFWKRKEEQHVKERKRIGREKTK